jgi:hypothetical protein
MALFKNRNMIEKVLYQKNTSLPCSIIVLQTRSNMLIYNDIVSIIDSLGKLFVNKMLLMLIFPGVK